MSEADTPRIDEQQLRRLVETASQLESNALPPGEFSFFLQRKDPVLEWQDQPFLHLYAAVGVVARDLDAYLCDRPHEQGELYAEIIRPIVEYDRSQFPHTTMFREQPQYPLPEGFAQAAASGFPTLAGLENPAIIHEWTTKPGKRICKKLGEKFRETICGPNGPYEELTGKSASIVGPVMIVQAVLVSGVTVATFLIPLLVLLAVIVVKTGLKTFCES